MCKISPGGDFPLRAHRSPSLHVLAYTGRATSTVLPAQPRVSVCCRSKQASVLSVAALPTRSTGRAITLLAWRIRPSQSRSKPATRPSSAGNKSRSTARVRGVAAVGQNASFDGPHNISLYDTDDPNQNRSTPHHIRDARALRALGFDRERSLAAHVAAHDRGLHVINHLALRCQGHPADNLTRHQFHGHSRQRRASLL